MKLAKYLAVAAGLALLVYLLLHFGAVEALAGVAAVGWGWLWVLVLRGATIAASAAGWRTLFAREKRPAFAPLTRARWIGEAINTLLPVAQVGGELARARMATRLGVSGAEAGATVAVDFTLGLLTQLLYALAGVVLLVQMKGFGAEARGVSLALVVAALALGGFFLAQRLKMFGRVTRFAERMLGRNGGTLAASAAELEARAEQLYTQRGALAGCGAWRMLSWLLQTGETWLVLYFLGAPAGLAAALIVESLGAAVRSGAFAVPGAVGVQEGGYVLLGTLVGVSPEAALSLALAKRVRELAVGIPGLLAGTWRG
jgi:putative membrane protein